jgi:hypothetical protein
MPQGSLQQDTYTPSPPDSAQCPHCQAQVHGIPAISAVIATAYLELVCPACRGQWSDMRNQRGVHRLWQEKGVRRRRKPA